MKLSVGWGGAALLCFALTACGGASEAENATKIVDEMVKQAEDQGLTDVDRQCFEDVVAEFSAEDKEVLAEDPNNVAVSELSEEGQQTIGKFAECVQPD